MILTSIRNALRQWIPELRRQQLRRAVNQVRYFGWQRSCNVCGSWLKVFLEHGVPKQTDYLCPVCRSKPPHRLAALLFDARPLLFKTGNVFVHIAPEPGLSRKLRRECARRGMTYISGDITGKGEDYLDVLSMPFANQSVDLIYCCHVLNMVEDDFSAMREIKRVLHSDGLAILQVPTEKGRIATIELNGDSEQCYLLREHGIRRLYSDRDYSEKLAAAGFVVSKFGTRNVDPRTVRRLALKCETLHFCAAGAVRVSGDAQRDVFHG